MVIGIIGAGLSGLTAGKILAGAGHEVTVIEKDRQLGGKLATYDLDGIPVDYGIPHFELPGEGAFGAFIEELAGENLLKQWEPEFALYDESEMLPDNPNKTEGSYYCAPGGISAVVRKLSRWVDVKTEEKAGGLTYIGADRSRKRAWMINLTDISVFECDAVIIATPAPAAYGILQTAQDETPARKIIRHIDEVRYNPCYALAAVFDSAPPAWNGIECEDDTLAWIGNESSKRDTGGRSVLVLRSTPAFARAHAGNPDTAEIQSLMLRKASEITGTQLGAPSVSYLHFWKYFEAVNPMNEYFMEMEMEEAPLALIGDYFRGSSIADAFASGYFLARYWRNKFSEVTVQ